MPRSPVQARQLVLRHGRSATAYQVLNPGMRHWFHPGLPAVVGYVRWGRMLLAVGEPVCPHGLLEEVCRDFEAAAATAGIQVSYFGAEGPLAALSGRSVILIGAQPVFRPDLWPLRRRQRASLRAQLNRARNKGVRVREWPPAKARNHPRLAACLGQWEAKRRLPLGFMAHSRLLDRLEDRRVFVATSGKKVVGFALASPVVGRGGWLLEQIVRSPRAPNGTAELLVDAALGVMSAEGCPFATLGLAPLSSRAMVPLAQRPLWLYALLGLLRVHGRRFYNFRGLADFKAKFGPETWEPIYWVSDRSAFPVGAVWAGVSAFTCGRPFGMAAAFLRELMKTKPVGPKRAAAGCAPASFV